jgi:hypothetical protein
MQIARDNILPNFDYALVNLYNKVKNVGKQMNRLSDFDHNTFLVSIFISRECKYMNHFIDDKQKRLKIKLQ